MDIVRLYREYGVHYATEGHKHCRPGWVQTECPFCTGNPGLHLGYDTELDRFVCWRCGGKGIAFALAGLLRLPYAQVYELIRQYGGKTDVKIKKRNKVALELPSNCVPLLPQHAKYLENRGYDAEWVEKEFGVMSTLIRSTLDEVDYSNRIIIPIQWEGRLVSFDSRDVTEKKKERYKACPSHRENVEHKKIIYGKQEHWTSTGICVEGYTDVWRFGTAAFCTSGIKFTSAQVRVIARTFKRVPVVYDDDPQAVKQADKLIAELRFRGVDAFRVDIVGDPGAMSQEEANYLVKQLM